MIVVKELVELEEIGRESVPICHFHIQVQA